MNDAKNEMNIAQNKTGKKSNEKHTRKSKVFAHSIKSYSFYVKREEATFFF